MKLFSMRVLTNVVVQAEMMINGVEVLDLEVGQRTIHGVKTLIHTVQTNV